MWYCDSHLLFQIFIIYEFILTHFLSVYFEWLWHEWSDGWCVCVARGCMNDWIMWLWTCLASYQRLNIIIWMMCCHSQERWYIDWEKDFWIKSHLDKEQKWTLYFSKELKDNMNCALDDLKDNINCALYDLKDNINCACMIWKTI